MTKEKKFVTLIEDPFQIPTLEVSEAQQSSDELDLDQDLDQKLDQIANAISTENQKYLEELHQINALSTDQADTKLAAQIAEDEALAQELQKDNEKEDSQTVSPNLDLIEIQACLETLLFIADKPLSLQRLRELLGPDFPLPLFQEAITQLRGRYHSTHHGIELIDVSGGLQFRTKPGYAYLAKKLAKIQTQRLSSGAMETLAITAYRQPVMKEEIDKIRGVDSSHFIRGLLEKKLIKIAGRSELPGRPILYETTAEFLGLFNLKDLSSMPPLREIEQMIPVSESNRFNEEDPKVKELRRLVSEMREDKTRINYNPREDEKILGQIRERINSIPTSTPSIEEQKALEKQEQQILLTQNETPAAPTDSA